MYFNFGIFAAAILIWAVSCGPSISSLAETDPASLIALEDSLLKANPEDEALKAALASAHVNLARTSDEPEREYQKAVELDSGNRPARYHLALEKGHRFYRSGSRNDLWEALESYGQAASLMDSLGEAHYWMAKAYQKKDDKDFDLIVEAYEKALSRDLPQNLRTDAEQSLTAVRKRQKTFEEFWK